MFGAKQQAPHGGMLQRGGSIVLISGTLRLAAAFIQNWSHYDERIRPMKLVGIEALGRSVSSIGFGCASLGGRIGVQKGIEALERAYEAGITWYDVAPSYGDGMAESILGKFASMKRDSICVCTKVGMRPADTSAAMRLLKPMARIAVAAFPGLTGRSQVRPKPFKVQLSAELIRKSVEESLRVRPETSGRIAEFSEHEAD